MMDDNKKISLDQKIMTVAHNMTNEQTTLLNTEMQIPNLAAIGAWDSIKSYNFSKISSSAFAGIITGLSRDDVMLLSALSTSVFDLF